MSDSKDFFIDDHAAALIQEMFPNGLKDPYAGHPLRVRFPQLEDVSSMNWWSVMMKHPSSITMDLLLECLAWEMPRKRTESHTPTEGLWGHADAEGFFALPIDRKWFILALAKQPWFQYRGLQRILRDGAFIRKVFGSSIVRAITELSECTVLDVLWFTEWRDVMDESTLQILAIEAMERAFKNPDVRWSAMSSMIKTSAKSFVGDEFFSSFMNTIATDEPELILRNCALLNTLIGQAAADTLVATAFTHIANVGIDFSEYQAWKLYARLPLRHLITLLKTITFLAEDGTVIEDAYRLLGFTAQQYPEDADVDHVVKAILGNLQFDWAPAAFLAFIKGLRGNEELKYFQNGCSASHIASHLCKETRYGKVAMAALQRAGWAAKELDLEEGPQGKQLQLSYRHDGETIVFVVPMRLYRDYLGMYVLYPTTPPERSTFRRGNVRGYINALPILTI